MSLVPERLTRLPWLRWAGLFGIATGVSVWIGQLGGMPRLATWVQDSPDMALNTAFCVMLCGVAFLALDRGAHRWAVACGATMTAFSVITQLVYFCGWSFGFDEWFLQHQLLVRVTESYRMPSNTVVAFVLLGLAVWGLGSRWRAHALVLGAGGVVAAFAAMPLVKFLGSVWQSAPYDGMSVPTMISLIVLATTLLRWAYVKHHTRGEASLPLLAAAFGMLVSVGVVSVQSNIELEAINRLVVHTHEVRNGIDRMIAEVARMENTMRGYALTGQDYYRQRGDVHIAEVRAKLDEVQALVADNPAQRARIRRLRVLAEEKFALNETMARARRTEGVDAAARAMTAQPTAVTSALVILADEVQAEETRLLAQRNRELAMVERNARIVRVLGGLIALGLFGAAVTLARRAATARQQAEAELRESEERFRNLAAAAFEAIFISENGRIIDLNQQALGLLGYERDEMIGREIITFVAPESRAIVAEAVRTDREAIYESEVMRKDGSRFLAEAQARVVRVGDRHIRMTALRDITERKRSEETLRRSQRMFQRLFESSPDAVVLVGRDARIVRANARAAAIFGWGPDELNGLPLEQLLPERFRGRHDAHLAGYFANPHARSMGVGLELFGQRKDGGEFPVDILLSPVETDEGSQALAVVRDITERKRLQENLARARDEALAASRLKSEFLATVSHEIRTPMNGILGMVGLLAETPIDDEQREMARVIQGSAESLLSIINDILDFSKIEVGKLRIQPQEFELRALIEETLALLAPRALQKKLRLTTDFGATPPGHFHGDAGRIRQVLTNLVGNAIKFTERGSVTVRVQLKQDDGARVLLCVSVEDTGIGIPREAHGRLFQPFTQVDGSVTRRYGGTGLGLAISRQLVTLMGGEIGFTSEPAQGSTFWFELSLARGTGANGEPQRQTANAATADSPARLHVLLVDDNPSNLAVARMLLEKMGHAVEAVGSGVRALELLAQKQFDAVLMDCQMPVLDGYETTRRIRSGTVPGADPRVPIIALTAHALPEDRDRCLAAGMNDYVSKPVVAAQLSAALHRQVAGKTNSPPPPPVAPAPGGEVLSARIVEMVRGLPGREGPSLWPEAVALFLRDEPRVLAELNRLAAARNAESFIDAAHTLAGSCASFGAMEMRGAALAAEHAARAGDWARVDAGLAELLGASQRLRAALAATKVAPA